MEFIKTHKLTLSLIFVAALSRMLPHPPNVTPIAAMALLGGAFLETGAAFVFPLAALLLSDLFLGLHSTMVFVYAGFVLTTFLGMQLRADRGAGRVAAFALAGSVAFFLITNFGVWLTAGLYPRDAAGLGACFTAALPFFRNSLAGDLFFTAVLFGLEHLSARRPLMSPLPS